MTGIFLACLLGAVIIGVGITLYYRKRQPRQLEEKPKPSLAFDDQTIQHLSSKSKHRKALSTEWDKQYLNALPPRDHPDYVEYSPDDELEDSQCLSTFGEGAIMRYQTYRKANGLIYNVTLNYFSSTVFIRNGRYSQDITAQWKSLYPHDLPKEVHE